MLSDSSCSGEDYSVRPATNSMPVFIKDVRCSGRELGLLECSFNRGSSTSDHTKDVAVKCRKCKIRHTKERVSYT